jgi:hypothetical protein
MKNEEIIELTDVIEEGGAITSGLGDFPAEQAVDPSQLDDELDALLADVLPAKDPVADLKEVPSPHKVFQPTTTEVVGEGSLLDPGAPDELDIFAQAPLPPESPTEPSRQDQAEPDVPPAPATQKMAAMTPAEPEEHPSSTLHPMGPPENTEEVLLTEPNLGAEPSDLLVEPDLAQDDEEPTYPPLAPSPLPQDPEQLPFFPALMERMGQHMDERLGSIVRSLEERLAPADLEAALAPLRQDLAELRDQLAAFPTPATSAVATPGPPHPLPEEAAALRQAVAAQNAEIEALRALIAARDAEVAAFKQQLAARDAQITALGARLEAMATAMETQGPAIQSALEARLQTLIEREAPRVAAQAIREELAQLMAEGEHN